MKRIIFFISLLVSVGVFAQDKPSYTIGLPGQTSHARGNLRVDSTFLNPLRDTTFTPWRLGLQIFRPADSSLYVSTSLTASQKWTRLGSGSAVGDSSIFATRYWTNTQLATKQNSLTTGTTDEYFRGDLSLSNFSSDVTAIGDALYAPISHTHIFSDISDGTDAVRNLFSAGSGITYNPSTGVIAASGSMVYPGAGIPVSTGSAWGTSLTNTTVGTNLLTAPNPGAAGYFRTNADNTITHRTYAQVLSDIGAVNIYNASGILTGNRILTGNNNTYYLAFDSLDYFRVSRDGVTRMYMSSAQSSLTSPNGLNTADVFNGYSALSANSYNNSIKVFSDSSNASQRISYTHNLASTYGPYSLITKHDLDSAIGTVSGGSQNLQQTLNNGYILNQDETIINPNNFLDILTGDSTYGGNTSVLFNNPNSIELYNQIDGDSYSDVRLSDTTVTITADENLGDAISRIFVRPHSIHFEVDAGFNNSVTITPTTFLWGTDTVATRAYARSVGGGGGVSGTINSGAAGEIPYYTGSGTTVGPMTGLSWDNTNRQMTFTGSGSQSPMIYFFDNTTQVMSLGWNNTSGANEINSAGFPLEISGDEIKFIGVATDNTATSVYAIDASNNLVLRTVASLGGGGTTINNNANNRIITGSGTANTLEGEANFTWDQSQVIVSSTTARMLKLDATSGDSYMQFNTTGNTITVGTENSSGGLRYFLFDDDAGIYRFKINSAGENIFEHTGQQSLARFKGSAREVGFGLDGSSLFSIYDYTNVLYIAAFTAAGEAIFGGSTTDQGDYKIQNNGNLLNTGNLINNGTLFLANTSAPSTPSGGSVLYTLSGELNVKDASGNQTVLSPHNFSGIPEGRSEDMAWAYYSERDGNYINVDMLKLARLLEKLTGEKLVYEGKVKDKKVQQASKQVFGIAPIKK